MKKFTIWKDLIRQHSWNQAEIKVKDVQDPLVQHLQGQTLQGDWRMRRHKVQGQCHLNQLGQAEGQDLDHQVLNPRSQRQVNYSACQMKLLWKYILWGFCHPYFNLQTAFIGRNYGSFTRPETDIDKMCPQPNGYLHRSLSLSSMNTSTQFYKSYFYWSLTIVIWWRCNW